MRKLLSTTLVILLTISTLSAKPSENAIGFNLGLTSVLNSQSIDLSNFSGGLTYQFNSMNYFGLAPRLDFDFASVGGFTNIQSLYKGSINAVYEFAPDNVLTPYILGGFGYEYVNGAVGGFFESKMFTQGGIGLTYHQADGYNFYLESKLIQIISGIRQENEIVLVAGVSIPISKFKRRVRENEDCPKKIDGPDQDRDGVTDMLDQCPNTPCYFVVDQYGCPIKATLRLNFDVDKYDIKPHAMPKVRRFAKYLIGDRGTTVKITGHTDSDGSDAYNMTLSFNRANAVLDQLVRFGVSRYRLTADGKGKRNPISSNRTKRGKALNRRIEVKLTYPITKKPKK